MAVHHEREQLAERQQEVEVLLLGRVRGVRSEQRAEPVGLLAEPGHVRHVRVRVVGRPPVVEADRPEAARRALPEQERVVGPVQAGRHRRVLGRVEQVVAHELEDQGQVDVDRALQLRQAADVLRGLVEVGVRLEALGRDDVPHQVDDLLALGGDLHLGHRVEQQVAAVLGRGRTEVVGGSGAEQLHRGQPGVRVGQLPAHVREVGDLLAVQHPVVGVRDGLVHRVLADADGGRAEVELADVDGVERGVEGGPSGVQDVLGAHRVLLEAELADVHLRVHHVLDQVVRLVPAVCGEEDVPLGALDVRAAPEHRHQAGHVAVADVVLGASGGEAALAVRGEHHVGGVDVRAVAALGEPEGHHVALGQQPCGACPKGLVLALPDRPETEDGDLPGVPVAEPVEAEDLVQLGDPGGVPALRTVTGALGGRRQEGREQPLLGGELEEVAVPGTIDVALDQRLLAA